MQRASGFRLRSTWQRVSGEPAAWRRQQTCKQVSCSRAGHGASRAHPQCVAACLAAHVGQPAVHAELHSTGSRSKGGRDQPVAAAQGFGSEDEMLNQLAAAIAERRAAAANILACGPSRSGSSPAGLRHIPLHLSAGHHQLTESAVQQPQSQLGPTSFSAASRSFMPSLRISSACKRWRGWRLVISCAALQNYPTCDELQQIDSNPTPLAVQASLLCLPWKPPGPTC